MPEATVITPYATAIPYIAADAIPKWLDEYNAQRLASYDLYDDMYDNSPSTYSLMLRGSDDRPIYVPTAKRLIRTMARYVGRGWGFTIDPTMGTPADQEAAKLAFSNLFAREAILSQFVTGKPEWLRRGDWVWYILADPEKPEGTRLSVRNIDPRTYFPITSETDIDRRTGAQLVEEYMLDDGKTLAIKEQRWLKTIHPDHPDYGDVNATEIAYESNIWDLATWKDVEKRKILQTVTPLAVLPGVTALPLYHIKNGTGTANPFGESELKGMESLVSGINQAISDEDLALATMGIGLFETDSGAPIDPTTKQPVPWQLGPGMVVEIGTGKHFNKIDGIDDVKPIQDHVGYLEEQIYGSSGINNIALGSRGSVQESGIALAIRMQPLFDAADEKDLQINSVLTQMFHDLATIYFPIYEGQSFGEVVIASDTDTGDRLPFDRATRWAELVAGFEANIFSLDFVHKELVEKFGYDLTKKDLTDALNQAATKASQADPYGQRAADELGSGADDAADDA